MIMIVCTGCNVILTILLLISVGCFIVYCIRNISRDIEEGFWKQAIKSLKKSQNKSFEVIFSHINYREKIEKITLNLAISHFNDDFYDWYVGFEETARPPLETLYHAYELDSPFIRVEHIYKKLNLGVVVYLYRRPSDGWINLIAQIQTIEAGKRMLASKRRKK